MILLIALGFGLGVLATVIAGERDKKRADCGHDCFACSVKAVASAINQYSCFGDVSLTECSEPTYGRFQDHT